MARPATVPQNARARLEAALERLLEVAHEAIAELDVFDGDPDLEDGGDQEPNMAQPDGVRHTVVVARDATGRALQIELSDAQDQTFWSFGDVADLEEQCEDEGGQCDDEGVSGIHDPDREPDADSEPDHEHQACHWQDEGDQTALIPHTMHVWPKNRSSAHQNVGAVVEVRTR